MNEHPFIKKIRIAAIIVETADARSFILEPLEDWLPEYQPGQFITLVFPTPHGEKRRSYSFSSSSVLNEPMKITVKKVDNGEFSRHLIYQAKAGDILLSSGISGFFLLPDNLNSFRQYVFLAAGSGITPCFSMIRTLLLTTDEKLLLIYSNRSESTAIFYGELKSLQLKYRHRFTICFLFSDFFNVYESRLSKWLLEQLLDRHQSEANEDTVFYTCGPESYMLMVSIVLLGRNVPPRQILKENFSMAARQVLPSPPDRERHQVIIHIDSHSYTIDVQFPVSILAAARSNRIELPYSCEAGRCGSCAATCISGTIWMAYNEVLVEEETAQGRVLTCQGFPIGGDAEIVF